MIESEYQNKNQKMFINIWIYIINIIFKKNVNCLDKENFFIVPNEKIFHLIRDKHNNMNFM